MQACVCKWCTDIREDCSSWHSVCVAASLLLPLFAHMCGVSRGCSTAVSWCVTFSSDCGRSGVIAGGSTQCVSRACSPCSVYVMCMEFMLSLCVSLSLSLCVCVCVCV